MQTTKDLYKLLGLPRDASQDDIRKAHRKLVREYHPDANPEDPRAGERFNEVQRAYEVLSDEKKRREYDNKRFHASPKGGSGRPRARGAGARTGGETTSTIHLSDLLRTLKDSFQKGRTGGSSDTDEDVSGGKQFGVSNKPREKRVKGPNAQRKNRVKGPSERRKRESD